MHTAASSNLASTPTAQVFVAQQDLVLYAALIGRKPMSKTLRESISEEPEQPAVIPQQPVMMTPIAASAHSFANDAKQRISVWVHGISIAAKKRLDEARSRFAI